jgi:acetolactate synthase-1/2/3 large subunit
MNVAEFLVRAVVAMGSDAVFSVTGGMAMHINCAVASTLRRVIYCNHEQAVVAAADGYAKSKDYAVPGFGVVTSGPGVMNTLNSVASAHYDSVPLVLLAGQVKTADINKYGVRSYGAQETPQLEVVRPLVKAVLRYDPRVVDDHELALVLSATMAGRKGPVFIEVPLDVQTLNIENADERLEKMSVCIRQQGRVAGSSGGQAAATFQTALATCRQPAVVLGNGLRIAGVSRDWIRLFVERLGIPALFTWPSADLLEHSHPLNFGCPGGLAPTHANTILQQADLLLFLGVRLDLLTTAFNPQNFGKRAKRIVVDCDPAEITKNQHLKNTAFFCEDVSEVIKTLTTSANPAASEDSPRDRWLAQCKSLREQDRQEELESLGGRELTAYTMTQALSRSDSARFIAATGSGFAVEGFARFFRARDGVTVAFAGHCLGSMGLALPMAIGAAVGRSEPVICLEGDGGLLFNLQEFFTLAANPDIPLRIIIMNNGGYQSIIRSQQRAFGCEFGASAKSGLMHPQFDRLAEATGIPYLRCETIEQFVLALDRPDKQCIIDAVLKEDGYRGPAVVTKFDANGKPYSTDIEDVSWRRG